MWQEFRRIGILAVHTAALAALLPANAEARVSQPMGTLLAAQPVSAPPDARAA